MNRFILYIFIVITLNSCFKEDDFVIKPIKIVTTSIVLKNPYSMYEEQAYFNLNDTLGVAHNNYASWDLGFESSPSGFHIILNTSKFMYAGNTELTDFTSITTNVASSMIYDRSSGNLDSTAIGNWGDFSDPLNPVFPKKVYIINLGVDENGNSFGFKKIVFEKLENSTYFIHYANLDNSDEHYFQIQKNSSVNFVQFSFSNGGNLDTQQPDKNNWDLNFTKYSTILFDDDGTPTPYLVRGVLINKDVSVARDTITAFSAIDITKANEYIYSTKQDVIGYDWKVYKNDLYIVKPHFVYIIRDRNNNYFKIRFTGFYNSIKDHPHYGEKGYPSFEFAKINIP